MLGGGNPVGGANPAGTGSSINYIGKHAYGYSGTFALTGATSADTIMMDFTTGNSYIMAKVGFQSNLVGGNNIFVDIILDGQVISQNAWDNSPEKSASTPTHILIPPNSRLQVKGGISDSTGSTLSVQITGRVY